MKQADNHSDKSQGFSFTEGITAMNPAEFKLLIHHHDVVFRSRSGKIHLTAGIARWVSALADHFKEIGLVFHESKRLQSRQDTSIDRGNVKLYSLGIPGHYSDRISRMRRIRNVCSEAGKHADGLLIRGLTPRQYTVWKHTPVSNKAFLLVRSIRQPRLTRFSLINLISAAINLMREYEFRKIATTNILMIANSPNYVAEIERIFDKKSYFASTNVIKKCEFLPLSMRPVSINRWKLLYVGRLHFLKGLRELLKALRILKVRGYECQLDIVGAREEPFYSKLVDLANQLGIANQVCWQGFVPYGKKLFNFYQSADVFVLPTYTEGFPRTFWEAAANGCPVITTTVGGIPALVKHEKHALLIPPKNPEAIAESVDRLLSDELLRSNLVKYAYDLALNFTLDVCAERFVDILSAGWK